LRELETEWWNSAGRKSDDYFEQLKLVEAAALLDDDDAEAHVCFY
jgi:hypothetical protein